MNPASPLNPPKLRPDLPTYPVHMQVVRVTSGTVPGPSGYMSSSVLGPSLYVGFVQQVVGTLLPRDREPCFVLDLNRVGLAPGYYDARLVQSHQSLPVYAVGGAAFNPILALSTGPLGAGGLTPDQIQFISTMSTTQIQVLANLTPCQLDILFDALPPSQIFMLTTVLTPTQIQNLVSELTVTELTQLYTQLTLSQIITLTSILTQEEIHHLVTVLTPTQIQQLITELTTIQFQILVTDSPADISYILEYLTVIELTTVLEQLTDDQFRILITLDPDKIVTLIDEYTIPQIIDYLDEAPGIIDIVVPPHSPTLTGTIDDFDPPPFTITTTPILTGPTTITGFLTDSLVPGQQFTILNPPDSGFDITLPHDSPGSDVPFDFTLGEDIVLEPGYSITVELAPDGSGAIDTGMSLGVIADQISGGGGTELTLAATGSVQGDAAPILTTTAVTAVVVSGADNTKGVILPSGVPAAIVTVSNPTANVLKVYPPSGAQINNGGTNNPNNAVGAVIYVRVSSTDWYANI